MGKSIDSHENPQMDEYCNDLAMIHLLVFGSLLAFVIHIFVLQAA